MRPCSYLPLPTCDINIHVAIGRSTNMVNPESNIIIIRGSSSRAVYDQLVNSFEQFFPDVEMEEFGEMKSRPSFASRRDLERPPQPLRRANTGLESIVGPENGDRPGGFVLVVDGSALKEVCRFSLVTSFTHLPFPRPSQRTRIRNSYSISPSNARV